MRIFLFPVVMMAAACNSAGSPSVPMTEAATPRGVTPSSFTLPEGSGCAGDVARLQAIINNDLETGHVSASVHRKIMEETEQAATACQAGRDAQASAMIAATRKRHGYPAG